jgi:hypothetical protein
LSLHQVITVVTQVMIELLEEGIDLLFEFFIKILIDALLYIFNALLN